MLANCLHALSPLAPDALLPLLAAMLLAGLAGGVTHCAGMCGPFVLVQATAAAATDTRGGVLRRLSGAALLPYQAGRAIGYAALGSFAGAAAAGLPARGWLAIPLGLAALAMLAQAGQKLGLAAFHLPAPAMPRLLGTVMGRILSAGPTGRRSLLLGLALSALPCGLLYGALAGAAAAGGAMAGALAMLAFVAGTVPGLTAVALLGRFFGRRHGRWVQRLAGLALLGNAALLAAMAAQAVLAT
jgi:sulfite exporter TauE/SafE